MDVKPQRLEYYNRHIDDKLEALHDSSRDVNQYDSGQNTYVAKLSFGEKQEAIDELLTLKKSLNNGEMTTFEKKFPDYVDEVNKLLTKEYGSQYKYKGGDAKFNIENILYKYVQEAIEEHKVLLDNSKEDSNKTLSAHTHSLTHDYKNNHHKLFEEKRKSHHRRQEISGEYRYSSTHLWKDDIQTIYHDSTEQMDEKYTELLTATEILGKSNRSSHRNKFLQFEEEIKSFSKSLGEEVTSNLKTTTQPDEITNYIHKMEDTVLQKISQYMNTQESALKLNHEELKTECSHAEKDMQNNLKEMRDSMSYMLENLEKQHLEKALTAHNDRNKSRGKG